MKSFLKILCVLLTTAASVPMVARAPSDFDGDGNADIVWRNRITGECKIWYMNGALEPRADKPPKTITYQGVPVTNPAPPGTNPDSFWRIVGTGDVSGDGIPDIIWQHMGDKYTAVWVMSDPDGSVFSTALVNWNQVPSWRLVGVADFNGDSIMDILWENETDPYYSVGVKAIWYMNTGWGIVGGALPDIPLTPSGWKLAGIGDYGFVSGGVAYANGNRDGNPDLVLQNFSQQQQAIWILDGDAKHTGGFMVMDSSNENIVTSDPNWTILGTADAGGFVDSFGPYSDLVFRNADFSDVPVYFLKGNIFQSGTWAGPTEAGYPTAPTVPFGHPDVPGFSPDPVWRMVFDQQWKLAGQDLPNPTARLASLPASLPPRQMTASITTSSCTLDWNLTPQLALPVQYEIRYKKSDQTTWQMLTNFPSSTAVYTYSGSHTFLSDERYDFNVAAYSYNGASSHADVAQTSAAINAKPLDNPGNVLLLIDEDLQAYYGSQMNQIVSDLTKDLVGDGWKVFSDFAPRHVDDYSQTGFLVNNYANAWAVRTDINTHYVNNGVNTILIIGHVVIPYSGYINPDGHGKRSGPADLFYGDIDGVWSDTNPTTAMSAEPEEFQYGAGDGRMDQSNIPALSDGVTYNVLELSVGRVDFARMSAPNNTMQAEVDLIGAYFNKTRKFRFVIAPYPLQRRAAAWSWSVATSGYKFDPHDMVTRFRAVLGADPSLVVSANSLIQQSASYVMGFTGGLNDFSSGYVAFTPKLKPGDTTSGNNVGLWHHPDDFLITSRVPRVGFHFFFCSYLWDWNLPAGKAFHRGLLAGLDYGLAAVWDEGRTSHLQSLGLGETLGAVQIHNVQKYTGIRTEHSGVVVAPAPENENYNHSDATYLAIMGDPTLRLDYLRPPPSASISGTILSWAPSAEPGVQYLAYAKDASTGSYVRVGSSSQPVPCCSVTLTPTEAQSPSFMVRATKTIVSGVGSYQGLSQGTFDPPL